MLKEAIQEIVQLTRQKEDLPRVQSLELLYDGDMATYEVEIEPTAHGRRLGKILQPFRPAKLEVSTLTGLIDAIRVGTAGSMVERVIHVEDYLTVAVKSKECDQYGVRDTVVIAKHEPINAFVFDNYYSDPARFIIALQVAFLPTDNLLYLIKIASNLKAGKSLHVQDDGFSQSITVKTGEVTTADVKIQPRIKLIPLRTFAEAAPVEGEFLIRFKQTAEETPAIALFNVDGVKWKGETMLSIKKYLSENLDPAPSILA
jgi:hypothetical protein